jgi:hypothetical protein
MRMFASVMALGIALLLTTGCDFPDRISRLEKENQELKAQAAKDHAATSAVADYDLQAKCSKDAKVFFNEGWRRDKNTILLDYSNHYNKAMNKCFIAVEYHYYSGENGSWINNIALWDVYENVKYGLFFEDHTIFLKPAYHSEDAVNVCEFGDKKCKTIGEFNGFTQPYMSN